MVEISIHDDALVVDVLGSHKLFALKSELTVPLMHVKGARHDPAHADRWWHGLKMPGTDIPGFFVAGTFWTTDGWRFWDVRHPQNAITIELNHEELAEIIVEVEDPDGLVTMINDAVRRMP
jgi:hypothetical protein